MRVEEGHQTSEIRSSVMKTSFPKTVMEGRTFHPRTKVETVVVINIKMMRGADGSWNSELIRRIQTVMKDSG